MQKGTGRFSRAKFPSEFYCSVAFFGPHPIVGLGANRPIVARTRTFQNGKPLYACRTEHGMGTHIWLHADHPGTILGIRIYDSIRYLPSWLNRR